MNNSKLVNDTVKKVLKRIEQTEAFVLEQAPDVAKEMILDATMKSKRNLILNSSVWLMSVGVVMKSALTLLACIHDTSLLASTHDASFGIAVTASILLIFTTALAFVSFDEAYNAYERLMYVKSCPKLFLLESFRKLVR